MDCLGQGFEVICLMLLCAMRASWWACEHGFMADGVLMWFVLFRTNA